jgi:hypothetical protein
MKASPGMMFMVKSNAPVHDDPAYKETQMRSHYNRELGRVVETTNEIIRELFRTEDGDLALVLATGMKGDGREGYSYCLLPGQRLGWIHNNDLMQAD